MNVTVIGNFDVTTQSIEPAFQSTGTWYEFFSGTTIEVSDVNAAIELQAGEYRLYTTVEIESPGILYGIDAPKFSTNSIAIYPNPVKDKLIIEGIDSKSECDVYTIDGKLVKKIQLNGLYNEVNVENLKSGIYFIRIKTDRELITRKIIIE